MLLSLKKRLLFLLLAFVVGFFITSLISGFVVYKFGAESTPAMRIVAVMQDIFMFVLPAIATAVVMTRQPAELLCVNQKIRPLSLLVAVCVLIAAIPAMNFLIWANENIPLPDAIEQSLRAMEDSAASTVVVLQGPHTIPNLIMSILIVGIFAGFSEELLFRGAFQRLMATGGINAHTAIWTAAFVFSMLHMQFYGFIPRMLLGAFFGYLLLWSGSIWMPIILHSLNNILYVAGQYFAVGNESAVDTIGTQGDYWQVAISIVMVASGLYILYKQRRPVD